MAMNNIERIANTSNATLVASFNLNGFYSYLPFAFRHLKIPL